MQTTPSPWRLEPVSRFPTRHSCPVRSFAARPARSKDLPWRIFAATVRLELNAAERFYQRANRCQEFLPGFYSRIQARFRKFPRLRFHGAPMCRRAQPQPLLHVVFQSADYDACHVIDDSNDINCVERESSPEFPEFRIPRGFSSLTRVPRKLHAESDRAYGGRRLRSLSKNSGARCQLPFPPPKPH